ncbi:MULTISPECIES: DNA repair helicase XPB [Fibrobacter]|nr:MULTISPECIES: DNA repair helicase XPB [Fibrobacter]MDD7298852.1 DEAD/DEAH box helicase [Fibrobacter intestinalis]PBC67234.1 DNA excision repair protein ERCC-3 [Fibrobacter sp. UWS1]PBC72788.1 DNA excision repair protein ERCC-3 [Fibrobacter sp. NR9]SJZ93718.1 DNA excision repair protein ERCC-3 [Fibrobacter intestinalis]
MNPEGAIIVQSNLEILVEVHNPHYIEARDAIAPFTELVKSPEHLHTYRISHLSLWNAASTGLRAEDVVQRLDEQSKYPLPESVVTEIQEYMGRYGLLRLSKDERGLYLESSEVALFKEVCKLPNVGSCLLEFEGNNKVYVDPNKRGILKMTLTLNGFPVEDIAGYVCGDPLAIDLREKTLEGKPLVLRNYQKEASEIFYASGSEKGGSGVIVLPCGSGKTLIGMATMALMKTRTLILTPNISSARQWIREILDKTTLTPDQVREYSGDVKEIGPVTVATYQILTQRKRVKKTEESEEEKEEADKPLVNFPLFSEHKWGLMIYDEVHLLPAPVFRFSAEMQATRRLGLTATLVREDGKETEVFSLIGPKKFDLPWKVLESQGWIATADCCEIRVVMTPELKMQYALAQTRDKINIASMNSRKDDVVEKLIEQYDEPEDRILIIGQYIEQLTQLSEKLGIPLITGKTPNKERDKLYGQFRDGSLRNLMVSKVGNFAIDLPDASILIQISGTFGSRQEEAQRLGRVLRPKADGRPAHFFSLVTKDSKEQEFSMNRQLFLTEQGYAYKIMNYSGGEIVAAGK